MIQSTHYIQTIALAALLLVFSSCSDSFLEIQPKGKLIATKTQDYDLLFNNLDLLSLGTNAQVIMGDEVLFAEPFFSGAPVRTQRLFRWDDDIYEADQDAVETLLPVRNLYIYNKIINEVLDSQDGTMQVKKSLQAEALGGRAWTNFLLISYYGKPYDAASAAADPGFPIITQADINATDFRRASVQQVYDSIVNDLTKAIPNFVNNGVPHRLRMSKAGAEGVLAKVYVFMGKFGEALPLLDASIEHLSQSVAPTGLYNFNTAYPGSPTAPNDQENIYAKQVLSGFTSANAGLMLTPEASALYGASDVRRARWYTAVPFPNGTSVLRRSAPLATYIGLRVPELYLLRAEVKARMDDLTGAVTDVETLRKNRMPEADAPVPAPIASDKMALLQFIFEERIREFGVQGYRWFDMRRLSVDPLFTTPTYTHIVLTESGDVSQTFTLRPERLTLRIPRKIRLENPNLQDNP